MAEVKTRSLFFLFWKNYKHYGKDIKKKKRKLIDHNNIHIERSMFFCLKTGSKTGLNRKQAK